MNPDTTKLRGLSQLIMLSLQEMAPDMIHHSQIIDCHVLPELEQQLRQKLVVRPDNSSRLVIDLLLSRSMEEVRQYLGRSCALPASAARREASLSSLVSI